MNTALDRQLKQNCCAVTCGLLATAIACGADDHSPTNSVAQSTNQSIHQANNQSASLARPTLLPKTTLAGVPRFQYKLSARDLDAIIAKHHAVAIENDSSQIEPVVVTSPAELVPMHSPNREVWGGLAAPFWAVAHPTQAWRIFLPIPPE